MTEHRGQPEAIRQLVSLSAPKWQRRWIFRTRFAAAAGDAGARMVETTPWGAIVWHTTLDPRFINNLQVHGDLGAQGDLWVTRPTRSRWQQLQYRAQLWVRSSPPQRFSDSFPAMTTAELGGLAGGGIAGGALSVITLDGPWMLPAGAVVGAALALIAAVGTARRGRHNVHGPVHVGGQAFIPAIDVLRARGAVTVADTAADPTITGLLVQMLWIVTDPATTRASCRDLRGQALAVLTALDAQHQALARVDELARRSVSLPPSIDPRHPGEASILARQTADAVERLDAGTDALDEVAAQLAALAHHRERPSDSGI